MPGFVSRYGFLFSQKLTEILVSSLYHNVTGDLNPLMLSMGDLDEDAVELDFARHALVRALS